MWDKYESKAKAKNYFYRSCGPWPITLSSKEGTGCRVEGCRWGPIGDVSEEDFIVVCQVGRLVGKYQGPCSPRVAQVRASG